jgi:hypothetical protein
MSRSALSVEEHFLWLLCYVQILHRIAMLVASSRDVPQFEQFAEFRAFAISIGTNIEAHALAIRAALSTDALRTEAPWP